MKFIIGHNFYFFFKNNLELILNFCEIREAL